MTNGESTESVLEEAADWLLRLQAAPSDPSLRAAHAAWRDADPRHARAWSRVEKGWRLVGDVPPVHADRWAGDNVVGFPAPRRRLVTRVRLGLAAGLAACLLLVFAPGVVDRLRGDHVTATAELREVRLDDGSVVHLGPKSALDVRFTAGRRAVALLDGEAFFDVVADAKRPFVIRAGDAEIAVVGTAFSVQMTSQALVVAVRNGAVEVLDRRSTAPATRLAAGDRIRIDRKVHALVQDKVAADEVGAWRERRLFVDGATVDEVAREIGRYSPAWIVIGNGEVANQRVTGLFDLRDPDRALAALLRPFGGEVRHVSPYLRILSGP